MNKLTFYFYYKKWYKKAIDDIEFYDNYKTRIENHMRMATGNLQFVSDNDKITNESQYLFKLCKMYDPFENLNFPIAFKENNLNKGKLKAIHFQSLTEMHTFLKKYFIGYFDKATNILNRILEIKDAEKRNALPIELQKPIPHYEKLMADFDKCIIIMGKITSSIAKIYDIESMYLQTRSKFQNSDKYLYHPSFDSNTNFLEKK